MRDGRILLEMVNRHFLGTLCQSQVHAVWVVDLAQQRANFLDVPIVHSRLVVSLL